MKKTFVIYCACVFIQAPAQNPKQNDSAPKGYFAIMSGRGMPIGPYASTQNLRPDDWAGYAKNGVNIETCLSYKLTQYDGITFMFRTLQNGFDVNTIEKQANNSSYPEVWKVASSKPWLINSFLTGWYRSFSFGPKKRFSIDFKGLLGMALCKTPTAYLEASRNGVLEGTVTMHRASASSFAYLMGVGSKMIITKFLSLFIQFDYLGTKVDFYNHYTTTGSLNWSTAGPYFTQKMPSINVNLGLGYNIK